MVLEVVNQRPIAQAMFGYNETALTAIGVAAVEGENRAHVAIGFVDYGFDLLHPTLLDQSGARSRFRLLWDQNRTPAAARAANFDMAKIDDWDAAWLDGQVSAAAACGSRRALDAIYDPHANNCGRIGTVGGAHGTMMASIAAGTPCAGFVGAAPDAELIGVQLALADHDWKEEDRAGQPSWLPWRPREEPQWDGWRSYDNSRQIVNAVRYILQRGCWLGVDALVINLSIGAWAGSHDAEALVAREIGDLIREADRSFAAGCGPRVIVVAGAGNAGADDGHWHSEVGAGMPGQFDWVMQRRDPTQNKLEIWYESDRALDVRLGWPGGDALVIAPGGTREISFANRRVGIAEHSPGLCGGRSCVRMLLHPPIFPEQLFEGAVETCAFSVTLTSPSEKPVQVNAWIEREDGAIERSWLSPSHAEGSLCCLATIPGALVVAGYDHHATVDGGRLAPLPASSVGPAPWVEGPAARIPHFTAPAHRIWGARSKSRGYSETSGTSAAVALTSGAIAQYLALHGATAPLPLATDPWCSRFGCGPFRIDLPAHTGVAA